MKRNSIKQYNKKNKTIRQEKEIKGVPNGK